MRMSAKKAIDKDALFQKILPALEENPFSTMLPDKVEAPSPDSLAALRERIFARPERADPNLVSTINVMETLVLRQLDAVMNKFNVCSCDRCRCDVAAYALNLLPPRYVVTSCKYLDEVLEEIPSREVTEALIKAVLRVRQHPRH